MSDYTDDTLSEAREWLAGPKAIHDRKTTELVERLQNELRRSDNQAQVHINAVEAVCDELSNADGFGRPVESNKIHEAIRYKLYNVWYESRDKPLAPNPYV